MSGALDPINDPENEDADESTFHCACGDVDCIGHYDDINIRIGKAWYAADCVMASHHPLVVEGREREHRADQRRGK